MALAFLIGGTGNQLFQYAASAPIDKISTFFLKPNVRRLLNWTDHEQIIEYEEAASSMQVIALLILLCDVFLASITSISLFTKFDTRRIKANPYITELVRFGYFQNAPERRSLANITNQISSKKLEGTVILHIRGGDILKSVGGDENNYGNLTTEYYKKALEYIYDMLCNQKKRSTRVIILTDDPDYASLFKISIKGMPTAEISNSALKQTFSLAIGADWFISSNSTMSYWIVRLRNGENCVVPEPFQRCKDFFIPSSTHKISIEYDE